ncbi:thiamine pyrophosphate-dependent enzyme [Thermospira aquatica]|uniref:Indolepyruvate oxidoreductase subunit IorA n=1 Tax=Thermospira aquatica TaxID=2828656 RepID=A0AAX3BBL4_9SPIR|nr:thiamine pyrophosphate-dependent enzyme [Thermospira aquatica]URA09495.1 indolepyruvate ferredoxin oxidoreductase subunit alpha [Thermospira aquatica]
MRVLLSGNEAVARGAYEAGAGIATGYPGTPSSEIIATLVEKYADVVCEWSVNEKVALEVAIGASLKGVRSLVTMKHVGLNVAADPLMTLAFTGVNAGLVIAVADDPGMHSSQNEQDSRHWGKFGFLPILEPSDSQEAKDFVRLGFEISERFEVPLILRLVTRVSHTRTPVWCDEPPSQMPLFSYQKDIRKYVMAPANAIHRHPLAVERFQKLREFSETFSGNIVDSQEMNRRVGILTHGLVYHHVKEVFPDVPVMKIGMYPLPVKKIQDFASSVEELWVVEELDPLIEEEVRSLGISVRRGKGEIPWCGELTPDVLRKAFGLPVEISCLVEEKLPARPPKMCQGCSHIPVFEVLRDMELTVWGDIGCYTLGAFTPYSAMDTCICMGAGAGVEAGFKKAAMRQGEHVRSVGVVGDSTFFHSAMTHVVNAVYNKIPMKLLVLDNHITAMTGHQPNPASRVNAYAQTTPYVDIEKVVRGLGVERVVKVSAYDRERLKAVIEEELIAEGPSVIIVDGVCVIAQPKLNKLWNRGG